MPGLVIPADGVPFAGAPPGQRPRPRLIRQKRRTAERLYGTIRSNRGNGISGYRAIRPARLSSRPDRCYQRGGRGALHAILVRW
jgi:hypothetical protein